MTMERKRTMTMNWDGLRDDDDDDRFFESVGRRSSAMPEDLASSSDDDDFEDSRMSFASVVSTRKHEEFRAFAVASPMTPEYDIWMAAPGSINARRKRLLEGMGLNSGKQFQREISKKIENIFQSKEIQPEVSKKIETNVQISQPETTTTTTVETPEKVDSKQEPSPSSPSPSPPPPPPLPILLVRSRSDGDIDAFSISKSRKDDLIGNVSKQRLTRTYSMITAPSPRMCNYPDSIRVSSNECGQSIRNGATLSTVISNRLGAFVLIKNLDTGKEFVVKGSDQEGMWNRLSDLETGKQLTMEEFEKCVGYSPVVKEMMQRENGSRTNALKNINVNSFMSKSLRMSKRRGATLLKNIKGSMTGIMGEKEMSLASLETKPSKNASSSAATATPPPTASEQWVKVRQSGRSYKELSALHFCQEIQAHEGSIWAMKFSPDARLLASAGEDRTIHVWEVQECEVMSMKPNEEGSVTPIHPSFCSSPDRSSSSPSPAIGDASPLPSEKRKKGRGGSGRKGSAIPDYVHVPESGFSLSEKPVTSFNGHQEDVLDLSWSSDSQLLLSSSMDKTVRLWDTETKNCLKVFAHNDYVTCIQFNPVDDNHFISGALDSKVRIWNIPDRYVVDWTDLHEMVTAACYSPDGQGAIIGSHKGSCRMYTIEDSKLEQKHQVDVQSKKSNGKKITGFQFVPGSTTEVLVTSADSRIRILDGTEVTQRFRGFRNTSSQLAGSFSQDGKYVICASEDSQVFVWKREEARNTGSGRKSLTAYRGHEHFPCKDVSIAIAWPGTISGEPPLIQMGSKRHSKRAQPQTPSAGTSPTQDENTSVANAKKVQLPPLPKKNNNNAAENNNDNKNNNVENNNDNKNKNVENNNDNKNKNVENNNDNKNSSAENNNNNKNSTIENNDDNKNNTGENNKDNKNNTGENNNDDKNNTGENNNNDDKNNTSKNNNDDKINTSKNNDDDKNNNGENNNDDDNNKNKSSPPDEEQQQQAQVARSDSKAGDSPSISSAAAISNNSSSSSWSSSWSWPFDVGNSHGHHAVPATAWGLVIVTAGLGGEIRVYQNFGLPRRIGRQANFWPAT